MTMPSFHPYIRIRSVSVPPLPFLRCCRSELPFCRFRCSGGSRNFWLGRPVLCQQKIG